MRPLYKTYILLTIFAAAICCVQAASAAAKSTARPAVEAPDFEAIKAATTTPGNPYYYPDLYKKFTSNDTMMTVDQYRHLYYGYIFQEDYDPYRRSRYAEKIEPLYYKASHTKEECDTIMKYAELSLADNPFDLRQMMFYIIALKEKQKNARAAIMQYRLNHLVGAIMSSGNGTEESPWHVISPVHEYNLLNFMNYVVTEHEDVNGGTMDYLKVEAQPERNKNGTAPEGFYFDVTEIARIFDNRFSDTPGKR